MAADALQTTARVARLLKIEHDEAEELINARIDQALRRRDMWRIAWFLIGVAVGLALHLS